MIFFGASAWKDAQFSTTREVNLDWITLCLVQVSVLIRKSVKSLASVTAVYLHRVCVISHP